MENKREFLRNEIENFNFKYPYVNMIKGTNELISYDVDTKVYYYFKIGMPVAMVTSSLLANNGNTNVFLDAGNYFIYATYFLREKADLFKIHFLRRYIEKEHLPYQKLEKVFNTTQVAYLDTIEKSYVMVFTSCLMSYRCLKYEAYVTYKQDYDPQNIFFECDKGYIE